MRLWPGSEILILPMLSYPDCHERNVHCLLWNSCKWSSSDINAQSKWRHHIKCISAYSGTSGSLFKNKQSTVRKKKNPLFV